MHPCAALLRQPGGLEGLRPALQPVDSRNQPSFERHDDVDAHFRAYAALLSATGDMKTPEGARSKILHFDDLEGKVSEGLIRELPRFTHGLMATDSLGSIRNDARHAPLDLWVEELERSVVFASVEGGDVVRERLDVFL